MKLSDTIKLASGAQLPILGLGTWQMDDAQTEAAVLAALAAGYRHIDTAAYYGNEQAVGRAIKKSGIPRDALFVTTKLWNTDHSFELAQKAIRDSLLALDMDYVDLYLIHWPVPIAFKDQWQQANAETWRSMERSLSEGLCRSIGVSNFRKHHMESLLAHAKIKPMVSQMFLNPIDRQPEQVDYFRQQGIVIEAYSPLGTGKVLMREDLETIAARYGKSVAQLAIRWSLQHGFIPLPKSTHPQRIIANAEVFDFVISDADMAIIDALQGSGKPAPDPDTRTF